MRIDRKISEDIKNKAVQMVNDAAPENKGDAIIEAMAMVQEAMNEDLVNRIVEEAARAREDSEFRKTLGLRIDFSESEKTFYGALKAGAKQSVTANQIDIIPTQIVDATLNDVKKASRITSLINFAPAGVQKWLTASKTGAAAWGTLTASITAELTAAISGIAFDVNKLFAYCAIPKAIRDLEIGYVDRYFRAILAEAMQDGIAAGYLNGDGKVAPIGVMRKIDQTESDGTHSAKAVVSTITGFSPAQLYPVLQTLSHGGLRAVTGLTLVCNPLDEYQYVNPALYGDSITGGYVQKSAVPVDVIADANCTQGRAVFTMPGYYVMGFDGVEVKEYKETGALDDVDYLIAKAYGNGRAADNDTAVVIDVTQLEAYIPKVEEVTNP